MAQMFATVAVGTDGSPTAAEAVAAAAEIARRFDAPLVLMSAYRESGEAPSDTVEDEWAFNPVARLREMLARQEEELRRTGLACSVVMDEGNPADVLVRLAEECGADLLVIGNKGMQRRVLGSVPNTVTHRAPCAVLVVKTT
jgi:nucleotide-binding universal stress UspA family protein